MFGRLIGGMLGMLAAIAAMVAMVVALVVFVVVAISALLAIAVAAVAYLRRDQWTKPAYRWARDKSGRWRYTPWNPGETSEVGS